MVHQSIVCPCSLISLNRSRDFVGEGETTSGTGRMPDFWPWQSQTVRCSSATAKVKLTVSVIIFLFLSPFVAVYSSGVVWTMHALTRWGYANISIYRFCFLNERQNVFIIAVHYYYYYYHYFLLFCAIFEVLVDWA